MGNRMPIPDERLQAVMESAGLEDRDLAKLWRVFRKCDKERNGTMTRNQFFVWLGERRTAFGDNLFEVVDLDLDSDILDFSEFVHVTVTYCMFGPDDVIQFCFYCFDKDKRGTIDKDELISLVEMLHASGKNSNVKKALKNIDATVEGKVTFSEFTRINRESPQLLFPAFRLQKRMKQITLGEGRWVAKKRNLAQGRQRSKKQAEQNEKLKAKRRLQQAKREKIIMAGGLLPYYFDKVKFWFNPYVSTAEQLRTELSQHPDAPGGKAPPAGKPRAVASKGNESKPGNTSKRKSKAQGDKDVAKKKSRKSSKVAAGEGENKKKKKKKKKNA